MNNVQTTSSSGLSLGGLLLVIFVVLKLTGNIAWSWWWVLSPLWIPFAILVAGGIIIGIIALIVALVKSVKKNN